MKKKILIFSLVYYPSYASGAESAMKDTTNRIDPEDIEYHLVTSMPDEDVPRYELMDNIHVHRVGFGSSYISKMLYVPLAALKARSLHKEHKFDGMWAMMTYMLFPLVCARALGVKVPYVLSLQDGDPYERVFERWFIRPFAPLLDYGFRNAAVIQVISSFLGTWPAKRGYTGPVEYIPDGANPRDFIDDLVPEEELDVLKKEIGKREGDILLTNTARLVHQKAPDVTIRALKKLPDHVKLMLVGGGVEDEMLKELTKELGLQDRVVFTGPVDRSEVTKYRRIADIFVGASRSEGLGHAFLSAMASRLPVVTTQVGGIADFLFDEKRNPDKEPTGWAVDVDSPDQIAEAVTDIMNSPDKVARVTANARKMVEDEYHWDAIARHMRERVFKLVFEKTAK